MGGLLRVLVFCQCGASEAEECFWIVINADGAVVQESNVTVGMKHVLEGLDTACEGDCSERLEIVALY